MKRLHVLVAVVSFGVVGVLFAPTPVVAHGGGLDGRGCHNDRKNGGYHCHRGPLAGQSFASSSEAGRALDALRNPPSPPKLAEKVQAEQPAPTTARPAPKTNALTAPTPPIQGPPPALKIKVTDGGSGWRISNLSPGYTWDVCDAQIGDSTAKLSPLPPNGAVLVARGEFKPPISGAIPIERVWITCKAGGQTFTATSSN